jgi:dihydropteroate synthase
MFLDPRIVVLDCASRELVLDRPRIMGIVNVTPDSFADGGRYDSPQAAVEHGLQMVADGADLLDIGGESTRPGADAVDEAEELRRIIPVIEALAKQTDVPISVDTSKPGVMRAAVAAGAGMINDVYALRQDGALDAAAALGVPVVLMHMQGEPRTMQADPHYDDVVAEVYGFFNQRLFACEMAGIAKKKLVIDPGFGFGKTVQHNLALLAQLRRMTELGVPVLAGLSRKRTIGEITGRELDERVYGSVAAALIAVQNGAAIVRVHDVAATVDALKVWNAVAAMPIPKPKASGPAMPKWPDDE